MLQAGVTFRSTISCQLTPSVKERQSSTSSAEPPLSPLEKILILTILFTSVLCSSACLSL